MGVASISHPIAGTLRFRTDPNSIRWTYHVNTKVDETYGGRVVQLLSASIEDLTVTADAGGGGWDYQYQVALFFRDLLFEQREGGEPATFSYPPRGWEMKVYALNFPFKDDVNDVARQFTMTFKVQEDITGVIESDSLSAEIAKLKEGVGWKHNEYNTPTGDTSQPDDQDPLNGYGANDPAPQVISTTGATQPGGR